MSSENPIKSKEVFSKIRIEIDPDFNGFVPDEFMQNPIEYFEKMGRNIKSGEIKRDKFGRIREDPTAVKEFPVWRDAKGDELQTIAKRVNIKKGKIGESGNPFYEYEIMKIVRSISLPAPRPVAKVEQQGVYLIVMEKVPGINWHENNELELKEKGFSDEDIENLKRQAEIMMVELQQRFEEAGIIRGWKLKDMIFDIDFENKKIRKIIPTDWERTKINIKKLEEYRKRIQG
ncbi:MAG: hypothetical protein KatS3mg097_448 [Candidatus Parcubacteria bacterium]|nr:MAG: hypothetical protein KatS3mg097_448 [Candidatus Parcubacteria bacterium]